MRKEQIRAALQQDDRSLGILLLVWLYRALLVIVMMAGVGWLHHSCVRFSMGGVAAVVCSYAALMVIMQRVYRAHEVGQVRVAELVMSQILANLVSLAIVYLGMALYRHQIFSALPMLAVLAVQSLLSCIWSLGANRYYFRNRRPSRTAVIYRDDESLQKIYGMPYFLDKYEVCRLIRDPKDDIEALRRQLEDCETVFSIGITATLANGLAKLCLEMGIKGYFVPHLGHIILAGAEYMSTFSIPMLRVQRAGGHSGYRMFKRLFDFCAALAGIIITFPVMALTALAIWLEDRGPVMYRQIRLTKNGKRFSILKFRSMSVNAESDGVARLAGENDNRITRVGRFIRSCRIDELPQLFNILVGDMSIVGPRPERPEIAEQYQQTLPEFVLRLQVKAGLTGLAQVYGRYNTEPYNKLQMDLMYINEMSLLKDLQLILTTVKILFMKESAAGVKDGLTTVSGAPVGQSHETSA